MHSSSFGRISPNVAFSGGGGGIENAVAVGLFYALPANNTGISCEIFCSIMSSGFGDLDRCKEREASYNEIIRRYFPEDLIVGGIQARGALVNTYTEESRRQITGRLYTQPIFGVTPSFAFNGIWTKTKRLREYTISLSKKICGCTFVLSGGLTYDDPDGGANRISPDRRLVLACSIPLGDEVQIAHDYNHYDDERMRHHASLVYTPACVPGLAVTLERYSKPGLGNPSVVVKYDGDYINIKIEENLKNIYANPPDSSRDSHSNQQRFFLGTSLSLNGIKAIKKSNFNVLRSAVDKK
jgi:hypothetical protein